MRSEDLVFICMICHNFKRLKLSEEMVYEKRIRIFRAASQTSEQS